MGSVIKAIAGALGLGGGVKVPEVKVPDYELERKKAEDEAKKKRAALAGKGMSGTILGGSAEGDVTKKKLLGE